MTKSQGKRAEELADEYLSKRKEYISIRFAFAAAIRQGMAEVRRRDAEVLKNPKWKLIMELCGDPVILAASDEIAVCESLKKIAAAIEQEPLP